MENRTVTLAECRAVQAQMASVRAAEAPPSFHFGLGLGFTLGSGVVTLMFLLLLLSVTGWRRRS